MYAQYRGFVPGIPIELISMCVNMCVCVCVGVKSSQTETPCIIRAAYN